MDISCPNSQACISPRSRWLGEIIYDKVTDFVGLGHEDQLMSENAVGSFGASR
jgi:hypothetical protein